MTPDPRDRPATRTPALWILAVLAATLLLLCAWLGQLLLALRTENSLLRQQETLTALELRAARNQLEAERLLANRELADLRQKLAAEPKPAP